LKDSRETPFNRIKGRTGFIVAIVLTLSTTLFLFICCASRSSGSNWLGSVGSLSDTEHELPTGFMVIEMNKTFPEGTENSDSIPEDDDILGIGPLPADSSFAGNTVILKETDFPDQDEISVDSADSANDGEQSLTDGNLILKEESSDNYSEENTASETLMHSEQKVDVTLEEKTPEWWEHSVKSGETLTDISKNYELAPGDIVKANGLKNPDMLQQGQLLLIPTSLGVIAEVRKEVERRKAKELARQNMVIPVKITSYVVAKGDNLWSISNKFNLSVDSLFGSNSLKNPDYLKPGTALRIPNQDGIFYKISKGDSLSGISGKYKLDVENIKKANPEAELSTLHVGQEIFLPGASPAVSVYSNGSTGASRSYSKGFRWPVMGRIRINSPFGWRKHPLTGRRSFHTGIDIRAGVGVPIRASRSGKVVYSGWMSGYGRVVVLNHGDGYSTLYAHCSKLLVRRGRNVSAGQVIAKVGASGRVTGPHLHFEVRKNNKPINPLRFLHR